MARTKIPEKDAKKLRKEKDQAFAKKKASAPIAGGVKTPKQPPMAPDTAERVATLYPNCVSFLIVEVPEGDNRFRIQDAAAKDRTYQLFGYMKRDQDLCHSWRALRRGKVIDKNGKEHNIAETLYNLKVCRVKYTGDDGNKCVVTDLQLEYSRVFVNDKNRTESTVYMTLDSDLIFGSDGSDWFWQDKDVERL